MNKFPFLSFFIYLTVSISLTSCEALIQMNVTVLNATTKNPVDSVFVKVNAGKNGDYNKAGTQGYTDSKGKFENSFMIGCAFGCYDIYTEYTKEGYLPKKDFNITGGIIYLTPAE